MPNGQSGTRLKKTVPIVEDEPLIALDMETSLEAHGFLCRVAGSLGDAQRAIQSHTFDGAVLDCHLGLSDSTPIADLLRDAKVPFVVCSGLLAADLPAAFQGVPLIAKPFIIGDLVTALERSFAASRPTSV